MLTPWFDGPLPDNEVVLGVPLFVIARIAKVIQLLSGMVIILEIVGEAEVNRAASEMLKRFQGHTFKRLKEELRDRFFTPWNADGPLEASLALLSVLMTAYVMSYAIGAISDLPVLVVIFISAAATFAILLGFVFLLSTLTGIIMVLVSLPIRALVTAFAFCAKALLKWESASRLALWVALAFLLAGFALDLFAS